MRASPLLLAGFSLVLAAGLWIVVFLIRPLEFWVTLSASTAILLTVALLINRGMGPMRLDMKLALLGVLSGVLLYLFFYAGFQVTKSYPIFSEGVGRVSEFRDTSIILIGLALIFPIGPGEEVYWRGLIQRRFSEKYGPGLGLLIATIAYAMVHLPTLNPPLVLTAFIGGLVWGYIYKRTENLAPVIISHVLFDMLIFVIAPIG